MYTFSASYPYTIVSVNLNILYFHAVFCCVGALAIAGALHHVDRDLLGWWLCERQCRDGGLNGRPEKLADVSMFVSGCVCVEVVFDTSTGTALEQPAVVCC
jgi:hypothetical protein